MPDLIPLLADEAATETVSRLLGRLDEYHVDQGTALKLLAILDEQLVRTVPAETQPTDMDFSILVAAIEFLGRARPTSQQLESQLNRLLSHSDNAVRTAATKALSELNNSVPTKSE